jgi:hypothetical protein
MTHNDCTCSDCSICSGHGMAHSISRQCASAELPCALAAICEELPDSLRSTPNRLTLASCCIVQSVACQY